MYSYIPSSCNVTVFGVQKIKEKGITLVSPTTRCLLQRVLTRMAASSSRFPSQIFETFALKPSLSSLVVDSYDGQCDQDARYEGEGIATFKSGDEYIGTFKLGMMWGIGKYTWKNGTIYSGTFKANEVSRNGTKYASSRSNCMSLPYACI